MFHPEISITYHHLHEFCPYGGFLSHGGTLWLWLTVRHGFSMALIEIDGLPNLKMGGSFHGELLVITKWYPQILQIKPF